MERQLTLRLASAGLTALLLGIIILFWAYPLLLAFLLLGGLGVLAYHVFHTFLDARLGPTSPAQEPGPSAEPETEPEAEIRPEAQPEAPEEPAP